LSAVIPTSSTDSAASNLGQSNDGLNSKSSKPKSDANMNKKENQQNNTSLPNDPRKPSKYTFQFTSNTESMI
jgi:hypothetical protein